MSCSANCVLAACCSITVNNGTLNGNFAGAGGGAVRARDATCDTTRVRTWRLWVHRR
jgi:hypothetical protein